MPLNDSTPEQIKRVVPCAVKVGLTSSIVKRLLGSARHAGYHSDIHVGPLREALERFVELALMPGVYSLAAGHADLVAEVKEARGRWKYPAAKISTAPEEELYTKLKEYMFCIYRNSENTYDMENIRKRIRAILIGIRSAQKQLDYARLHKYG